MVEHTTDTLFINTKFPDAPGLFSELKNCFDQDNYFSPRKLTIFNRYFGFIEGTPKETLQKIGDNLSLTRERIRQISTDIIKYIDNSAINLAKNANLNIHQYFSNEYFIITDKTASEINQREGTNFTKSFICYIISIIKPEQYEYFNINDKLSEYTGIFFKKSCTIDVKKSLTLIYTLRKSQLKVNKARIGIDQLLEQKGNSNNPNTPKVLPTELISQLYDIVNLYNDCLPDNQPKLKIKGNHLYCRSNLHKTNYEYIIDILESRKRPMHFSEIYKCLLKAGVNVASALSVHSTIMVHPELFGLKGPGYCGLINWGGYFGTVGNVAEQVLSERNQSMDINEMEDLLMKELVISRKSIRIILFNYNNETRFIHLPGGKIALKKWSN